MDFLQPILNFLQTNSTLVIIGLAIFLFATGRIDLAKLLELISKPKPTPTPGPTDPAPQPTPGTPLLDLLKLLLPLLLKAKLSGDKEQEDAILKVMAASQPKE